MIGPIEIVILLFASALLIIFSEKLALLHLKEFQSGTQPTRWFARTVYLLMGLMGIVIGIALILKSP